MANEVQKSIQISYKADLKDLMAKLKQIPNVTDQEAKKMVSALDRQLKQAEKAAKKSADASQKAAKEAGKAATIASKNFNEMANSADAAEEKLEEVADASGDIDRGFSSIGLALREVNPQLADAADGLADAFAVTEGLTSSFMSLNPAVIASAVAVGALTLGYMSYQQEIEKARELTLAMKEAQNGLNDSYKALRQNFDDSLNKLGDLRDQYAVLSGSISEYDMALRQTERQTKGLFTNNIEQQQKVIDQRKEELLMIKSIMAGNLKSVEFQANLSEVEKERLRTLQLLTQGVDKSVDLTKHDMVLNNQLAKIRGALTNEIRTQEKAMSIIVGHQKEAVSLAIQIQQHENDIKQQKENQVKEHKTVVTLQEDETDNLRNLIQLDQQRFKDQQTATKRLEDIQIETFMSKEQRDALSFGRELEMIEKLGEESNQSEIASAIIAKKLHDQQMESLEEQGKKEEELREKRIDGAKQSLEGAITLANVLGDLSEQRINNNEIDVAQQLEKQNELSKMSNLERQAFEQDKKQQMSLFRFRKGMAIADIAMSTAEAVASAQKLIAPFNAIKTAIAIATGAAQTAIVMGQKPPSFHMGGMAPDEMGARVLQGEAVLDRATVQRIGGEEGVQQLQQGSGMDNQVVVIQPFRHFGRFAREIGFRPQKQTGIRAY